ncbi:hypothetical protein GCM10023115_11810 [Pontixanthobacter gangjinensis]
MHGPKDRVPAPLGGTRFESLQRLQVGISGIVVMIMLVGLADVIRDRADQTDANAVPEASATVTPGEPEGPRTDPMVDAGVVPDLPTDPDEITDQDQPVLPEQGNQQTQPRAPQ